MCIKLYTHCITKYSVHMPHVLQINLVESPCMVFLFIYLFWRNYILLPFPTYFIPCNLIEREMFLWRVWKVGQAVAGCIYLPSEIS